MNPESDSKLNLRNLQRAVGAFLMVGGVVVLILAMNATHSAADQTSNALTGHFTESTMFFITAGFICIGSGLATLLFGDHVPKSS
jgi:hypothetical protein